MHEEKSRVVAREALADMFSVSHLIQWNDLVERLWDLDSPERLFNGHKTLLQIYTGTTVIRTILAVALVAVSLNNSVALHKLPCKHVISLVGGCLH